MNQMIIGNGVKCFARVAKVQTHLSSLDSKSSLSHNTLVKSFEEFDVRIFNQS
ncbi:hypothetical protein NC651_026558 [Populus alba x Populus x berolinensis]|nr:hypothetical protein NC651_026558 [Populus alba x Populus x berolinensis]